jgi:hypothetical protein
VSEEKETKKDTFAQEEDKRNILQRIFVREGATRGFVVPLLAVITALVLGAFVIAFTSPEVWAIWGDGPRCIYCPVSGSVWPAFPHD